MKRILRVTGITIVAVVTALTFVIMVFSILLRKAYIDAGEYPE